MERVQLGQGDAAWQKQEPMDEARPGGCSLGCGGMQVGPGGCSLGCGGCSLMGRQEPGGRDAAEPGGFCRARGIPGGAETGAGPPRPDPAGGFGGAGPTCRARSLTRAHRSAAGEPGAARGGGMD